MKFCDRIIQKEKVTERQIRMAKRRGLSFYGRRKKVGSVIFREMISYILGILFAVFLAVVLTYFWGMSTKVIGSSMEPVLYNGQTIYIDRFSYVLSSPKAGDVVVFLPNGNENTHYYVKRVLAVPGDSVRIENGICYVNGEASPYVISYIQDPGIAEHEIILENETYFCVGDNPQSSEDSRSANIGPVEDKEILGKVWFHGGSDEAGFGFVK